MTRDVTTAFRNQVEGDSLSPFYAVEMEFEDDAATILRYWTGYGEITFDSKTFGGFADFMSIEVAPETTDVQATGAMVEISGLNPATIALALGEQYQGNPFRIWLGVLDASGSVIADPYMVFEGKMDVMNLSQSAGNSLVSISSESSLIDLNRSRVRRYTDEDQKSDYPTDRGLEYVPTIQDLNITWGRPTK